MIRKLMLAQFAFAAVALAQAPALEKAPVIKPNHMLACPAGTKQVGGPKTNLGALACMKFAASGLRLFHGPMISFYGSGKVEAVGQSEEGFRTGKWSFFDEAGNKVGETEFLHGDYHGRRAEFTVDGKLKLEENWVNGKRQGPQKSFDAQGVPTVTEYRDDRPVTK
ncbi:MAG: hypothetical protein U0228_27770 [Myxococcaceae bacterium]